MITQGATQTTDWGRKWAQTLKSKDIVALYGDLGTGKTTLVKGVVEELAGVDSHNVQSPTFTLLNIYEANIPLFHFDLYRLKGPEEFIEKGFLDYFGSEGICLIEWPERIEDFLPENTFHITLSHLEEEARRIDVRTS